MNEEQVKNWFGNRGQYIDDDAKLTYQVVTKDDDNWIFIVDDCFDDIESYDEVELYYLDTIHVERQDTWKSEGFDWSTDNLLKLIPKE